MAVQPCQQINLGIFFLHVVSFIFFEADKFLSADGAAENGFLSFYRTLPEVINWYAE